MVRRLSQVWRTVRLISSVPNVFSVYSPVCSPV